MQGGKVKSKGMKNINFIVFGIVALILFSSCISKKTNVESKNHLVNQQRFTNQLSKPIFPNCESSNNVESCLLNSVSELILVEADRQKLNLKNDTLKIGFKVEIDGTVVILDNETKNKDLKKVSQKVLNSLPIIEPAYSKTLNKYVASSYTYFVLFNNNIITNKF